MFDDNHILSGADIEKRWPVWDALSELFLDTELSETAYQYIAKTVAESEFSPVEINTILWREVFPAVSDNLRSVAGEWAGFDRQWLQQRILSVVSGETTASTYSGFMSIKSLVDITKKEWAKVCDYLPSDYRARRFNTVVEGLGAGEGLDISFDQSAETKNVIVKGVLFAFVPSGSQYARWRQFPSAINYTIRNLDNDDIYNSLDNQLSISECGNDIFDYYSKQPCDTIISKDFSVDLNNIFFISGPKAPIFNFELQAEYAGQTSNTLIFKNMPFILKNISSIQD